MDVLEESQIVTISKETPTLSAHAATATPKPDSKESSAKPARKRRDSVQVNLAKEAEDESDALSVYTGVKPKIDTKSCGVLSARLAHAGRFRPAKGNVFVSINCFPVVDT